MRVGVRVAVAPGPVGVRVGVRVLVGVGVPAEEAGSRTKAPNSGPAAGGSGPADRRRDGEAGHGDRDGAARVGAGEHRRPEEVLGVADLIAVAGRQDARQVDAHGAVEVPVVDGDVGAAGLVLVGADLGPGSRRAAGVVGVARVLGRGEAADGAVEGVSGHREAGAAVDQLERGLAHEVVAGHGRVGAPVVVAEVVVARFDVGRVGVVGDHRGRVGHHAAADQKVLGVALDHGERPVAERGVALFVDVVDVIALGVGLRAHRELVEEQVVDHLLDAGSLVLKVDAVAVATVGSVPAVVVDEVPVDLGVGRGAPNADALARVVDDRVDDLGPGSPGVEPEAQAIGRDAARDGIGAHPAGVHDLDVHDPRVGPMDVEGNDLRRHRGSRAVRSRRGPVPAPDDRVSGGARLQKQVDVLGVDLDDTPECIDRRTDREGGRGRIDRGGKGRDRVAVDRGPLPGVLADLDRRG